MTNNIQDLLKTDNNLYLCLENNRTYTHPRTIVNLLIKKNLTVLDYCIKWNLVVITDYIQCKICNHYTDCVGKHLSVKHKQFGGITYYKKLYGDDVKLISDKYKNYLSTKMSGENNHNHTSNTTLLQRQQNSPFCIEFWKLKYPNKNEDLLNLILKQFQNIALSDREFTTQLQYYIDRGHNENDALKLLKERQTTFSFDICVQKHGQIKGLKIFNERQNKWLDSLLNNGNLNIGYSQISQELFDSIRKKLPNNNFKYATFNDELRLKYVDGRVYLYDFADVDNNKIIEFHGDLFHGNPQIFNANDTPHPFRKNILAKDMWEKDQIKALTAKNNDYDILIIWESEYKRKGIDNKEKIIKRCVDFILS